MFFWIIIFLITLFVLIKRKKIIKRFEEIKNLYERIIYLSETLGSIQNIFPNENNSIFEDRTKYISKLHFDPSFSLAWIEFENEGKIYKTYFPYSYFASKDIKVILVYQDEEIIEITHYPKLAYGFSAEDFGAEKIIVEKDSKIIKELDKKERLLFYEEV